MALSHLYGPEPVRVQVANAPHTRAKHVRQALRSPAKTGKKEIRQNGPARVLFCALAHRGTLKRRYMAHAGPAHLSFFPILAHYWHTQAKSPHQ